MSQTISPSTISPFIFLIVKFSHHVIYSKKDKIAWKKLKSVGKIINYYWESLYDRLILISIDDTAFS